MLTFAVPNYGTEGEVTVVSDQTADTSTLAEKYQGPELHLCFFSMGNSLCPCCAFERM